MSISTTVHPRLRGELVRNVLRRRRSLGSSPLTRGTLNHFEECVPAARFIPAYAGNSCSLFASDTVGPVHPRLRGELSEESRRANRPRGSSPLTRGTQFFRRSISVIDRFIPAYAGNSERCSSWETSLPVHPRLRGELASPSSSPPANAGSSPLTRGTLI